MTERDAAQATPQEPSALEVKLICAFRELRALIDKWEDRND